MLEDMTRELFGKGLADCDDREAYEALVALCKRREAERPRITGDRKLYYLSAEFLIGRLLANTLINLGLYETVRSELAAAGKQLAALEEEEPEPSLGNGGLGRLAACFLDSIATLGLCGDGVGLNYHFGLFRQTFEDRQQRELPNPWLSGSGWLRDSGVRFSVPFGRGTLTSVLYDLEVVGFENGRNRLRLFDLETVDEGLVGEGIAFDKTDIARNLTLFLYPDDSGRDGRLLRIYQQYFLVSSAAQLILRELKEAGHPLRELYRHAVIQINDTHPSMVIPELIRLLLAEGLGMDEAVSVVSRTCAYTNHTILAEALETWPLDYLEEAVPQLVPIIRELDRRVRARFPGNEAVAIIDGRGVHMAHLDIHYGFSVNGVAALHTEILEKTELNAFYRLYPERFNNKTNGVTLRRWLMAANPRLADYITARIGEGWKRRAEELEGLLACRGDAASLEELLAVKAANKRRLRDCLAATGIEVDPDSVFDIQIKRLHEYKRQQMNALYIIHQYREIQAGRLPKRPVTVIFGAKAAPAYVLAKDIIHLILCLSKLINEDPAVRPWLRVVMVENYNVSWAERLIPACDISEQISLASKEASGTGNMKLMLNGAVTLGTLDGANVEIAELVGEENIFLFGKKSEEVIRLSGGGYNAAEQYRDSFIRPLVDFLLEQPLRSIGDPESLGRLYRELTCRDAFMTLLDLRDYIETKGRMLAAYEDRPAWAERMLVNIAKAGYFSSDRTIEQYNEDIWKLK